MGEPQMQDTRSGSEREPSCVNGRCLAASNSARCGRGDKRGRGGVVGAKDLRRASGLCYKQHRCEHAPSKLCR
jgi:hypothetical protein